MSVGACAIHDRCFVYVNEALVEFLGRPREALLGQPFTSVLEETSAEELTRRHSRRIRGERVPTTYEATVRTTRGDHRTEMTVIPNGEDYVVLVRDVSPRCLRRAVLQRMAELGAGLPSLRTEGEVLRRMFSGLEETGLGFAWLSPEGTGVRLGQTFVPQAMLPPESATLSGRWIRDVVGHWCPLLERAWREGAAYSPELPEEVAGFLEAGNPRLADAARSSLQRAGQPHVIAVRIDVEGQPRALLALGADWLREEEVPSARLFGAQVSAALDAALTISRLSAQNTALAALNRLASEAASAPHPRAFFDPGTAEIVGLLGCDAVALLLPVVNAPEVELAYARGLEEERAELFTHLWLAGGLGTQAQRESTVLARDVESCRGPLREELLRQGFRTVAVVPLRVSSRGVGTLAILFRERRPLTPLERETLQAMGSHFAAAIESHRLLHELRGRAEDMALLHEVGKALAATLELDKLLATGVTSLARIVDTPDAYVLLPDATGEQLVIRAATGAHPEMVGQTMPTIPAWSSLAALAFQTREVVMVEDAEADLRVNQEVRRRSEGTAFLVLPLVVHERTVGVLMAAETRRPRRFTPAEVERASAIANQLALAREGARLVEDLKASYVELARTQAQLVRRERLAALGELSAVVAHEVRNPLGAIFNSVASIRRIIGPESPAIQLVDIVGEEADRLNRIVADLLTFARPPAPHPYAVPLSPLVEDAVRGALAEAAGKVRVELDLSDDVPSVTVDERMMRQAFLNLAINAVQAMPQGGLLRASVRRAPGSPEVEVQFADSGPGISPEVRARIFEPFFTTKAKGTGLGLAVVKRIIESHQGRVALDSQPGRGTTFRLYLPLDASAALSASLDSA
ncbi:GAF domain-containing protein [Pyxidicoccus fallax]|uniref:histidine kinase n=1 Tax=Pyxidicoccus fallax TaxID=394095 RepID=A0A848LUF6_9BACT|nr:ATP-binding protein [Pyxidicoccus fallax]NMO21668.1 GAF domain-containing protein [Pyxidicoccus fallax]NPC82962.1 GAF domain-containing protein [Pyxidicoccus fallax]